MSFTEYWWRDQIGRISPTGDITNFPISDYARAIVAGPDGNFWLMAVFLVKTFGLQLYGP